MGLFNAQQKINSLIKLKDYNSWSYFQQIQEVEMVNQTLSIWDFVQCDFKWIFNFTVKWKCYWLEMNTDVGLHIQFYSLTQNALKNGNKNSPTAALPPTWYDCCADQETFIEGEEEEQELSPISYGHHPNSRENAARSICTWDLCTAYQSGWPKGSNAGKIMLSASR